MLLHWQKLGNVQLRKNEAVEALVEARKAEGVTLGHSLYDDSGRKPTAGICIGEKVRQVVQKQEKYTRNV